MKTIRIQPEDDGKPPLSPGSQLGGYRIVRQLGRGGMGTVYEAEEIENGRRIALKILSHGFESPVTRARFRREGLLAASINHPNAVYVFGTDEIDGYAVIAMELVQGGTLQDWVNVEQPPNSIAVVDAILQVIAGLEAAAERGVLHRDIKPANCFIEIDGTIKVGDFGLAISTGASSGSKLTVAGTFLGTPAFCSPEQVRGDEFTLQGDIYAVGITLYYLITGRVPFEGDDPVRMLATVLERTPESPAKWRRDLPPGLCRLVLRCLEKQPERRFRSYDQLRKSILPYSSTAPTPATLSLRFLAAVVDGALFAVLAIVASLLSAVHWDALINPEAHPRTRFAVSAIVSILNLVYFVVLEGWWGMSLGKRLCGVRVVGRHQGVPGIPRAFLRAVLVVGLPNLPHLILFGLMAMPAWGRGIDLDQWRFFANLSFLLIPGLFITARRRNGFAAVHDLVTGTRVVQQMAYGTRPQLESLKNHIHAADGTTELGFYQIIKSLQKRSQDEILLGFDSRLLRSVWIRCLPRGSEPVASSLKHVARAGRLRWLGGERSDEECWDAYEAGPGTPLVQLIRHRQPWHHVRYWLTDLAEELAAAARDKTLPLVLALDRVWITADGRAKLLDFPVPLEDGTPENAVEGCMPAIGGPTAFLGQVAVALLEGRSSLSRAGRADGVKVPLPPHARELLGALNSGIDLATWAERMKPCLHRLSGVSVRRRAALIAGGCLLPVVSAAIGLLGLLWMVRLYQSDTEMALLRESLSHWASLNGRAAETDVSAADRREEKAFEVYIAGRFHDLITNRGTWTRLEGALIPIEQREAAEAWVRGRPTAGEDEFRQAAQVAEPIIKERENRSRMDPKSGLEMADFFSGLSILLLLVAAMPSVTMAFVFRGGLVLRVLGIQVVRSDGGVASRLRILLRSVIAWIPVTLSCCFTLIASKTNRGIAADPGMGLVSAWVVFGALTVWAALLPRRGLQDRLAGTCLIPRD